ncbi:Sensor kinase CckA [subsurface metagenome]
MAKQEKENRTLTLQLGQLQALANIGLNTTMMAHEINNLLTPLINYAALSLKNPEDKALTEKVLQKTFHNSRRASEIMASILAMTKKDAETKTDARLLELVEEIFTCLCRDFSKDSISVQIQIPRELTIYGIGIQLQQMLMNLILNAREAMLGSGGVLKIKAEQNKDSVTIEVSDTGCGIAKENLGKIFEPFFTTKTSNESQPEITGSGLGLSFCKKVIDSHNGTITVESEPAKGSVFKIVLPVAGRVI